MSRMILGFALLVFWGGLALGQAVVVPHAYLDTFAATGDLDNTTDVSIVGPRAGRRHCATDVSVSSLGSGADMVVRLLSNDTVIWQCAVDTAAVGETCRNNLLIPVCTTAGQALEIDVSGDPTDNLIFYDVHGYTAP